VSILVAAIIYLTLMIVVFKVAGTLTRGWRLGRARSVGSAAGHGVGGGHQERPLNPAPVPAVAALVGSDRVRSTVASLETMSSSHRFALHSAAPLAMPAPAPQLALAGPKDAREQLRYLHHRVAGVSNTHSREMLR